MMRKGITVSLAILIFALPLMAKVKVTLQDGKEFEARRIVITEKVVVVYIDTPSGHIEEKEIPKSKIKSIEEDGEIREFVLVSDPETSQAEMLRAQQNIASATNRIATIATLNLALVLIAGIVLAFTSSK